jgi:uncharacterized lipoprotein YddW (UPF0748 family)
MILKDYNTKQPLTYFSNKEVIHIPDQFIKKPFFAMWVSNVMNIDLPIIEDIIDYQNKIIEMLDVAKSYHITDLMFQVRTTNDAFYESKLNPYSRFLTGQEGKKPPIDIMKWIIEQTHKAGIKFHAWCNPYRISVRKDLSVDAYLDTCDDLNFAKKNPHLIITDPEGKMILNPARQEVKDFIIESMIEIIQSYDVDGIHFDDYFYPYGGLSEERNDLKEFDQRIDLSQSLGDFRRQQVTDVIDGVHKALKNMNPNIRFGVSPFGIWKTKANDPEGIDIDPKCGQSFYGQYADAKLWVEKKMLDYIVPQVYWDFSHHLAPFADIVRWWAEVCKNSEVDLYIGHGPYRLGTEGGFLNPLEIVNQIAYAASFEQVKGHVFFTYNTFISTGKQLVGMQSLKKALERDGHEKN